jgi:hypothetical protein
MSLFEQMQKVAPKRNPVFTAIEKLKDPTDIKQFMRDYEEWMLKNGDLSIRGREAEVARSNVGYILGYYDGATAKLWYGCLDNVSHPIFGETFGRGKDVTPEEAFNMGVERGKRTKEKKS